MKTLPFASRVVLVAVASLTAGCSADRVPTALLDATSDSAGKRLTITVATCGGNPEVTEVAETATEVRVRVISDEESGDSLGCAQALVVPLDEPLGDRVLIDDSTGDTIRVS